MGTLQTLTAMVVLILALCVIVQAVQELLKKILDTKAEAMKDTIKKFMGEHLTLQQVTDALATRGLDVTDLEHFSKEDFRHLLDGIDLSGLKIDSVVKSAQATIDDAKNNIAAAYDGARAQFQKLYAEKNKTFAFIISFVVVIVLNSNIILIYEQLATDQVMSQAIVGHANEATCGTAAGPKNLAAGVGSTANPKTLEQVYDDNRACISKVVNNYPIIFRWKSKPSADPNAKGMLLPLYLVDEDNGGWFKNTFGLLAMGLLVSLGTPFWNDVLKGATGVNNALNTAQKKN